LTPTKDPINIQPDPVEDAQVDDIKSERRAASNRNQWAASRWNAWADKSESALEGSKNNDADRRQKKPNKNMHNLSFLRYELHTLKLR